MKYIKRYEDTIKDEPQVNEDDFPTVGDYVLINYDAEGYKELNKFLNNNIGQITYLNVYDKSVHIKYFYPRENIPYQINLYFFPSPEEKNTCTIKFTTSKNINFIKYSENKKEVEKYLEEYLEILKNTNKYNL